MESPIRERMTLYSPKSDKFNGYSQYRSPIDRPYRNLEPLRGPNGEVTTLKPSSPAVLPKSPTVFISPKNKDQVRLTKKSPSMAHLVDRNDSISPER